MLSENILYEMRQRPGERTGDFLKRQAMVRNTIREINAREVHLGFLLADEEPESRVGSTLPVTNGKNINSNNTPREAGQCVSTIS